MGQILVREVEKEHCLLLFAIGPCVTAKLPSYDALLLARSLNRLHSNMFKRLNVRNARKAREEEMGLDSEMKEVLGLNDTDSDESSSSSSDSEASVNAEPVDSEMERDEDDASVVSELRAGSEVSGDDVILVSMEDAVGKPLYEVGNQTLCIFCDGKTMRSSNTTMIQTHLTSQVKGALHLPQIFTGLH